MSGVVAGMMMMMMIVMVMVMVMVVMIAVGNCRGLAHSHVRQFTAIY